MLGKITQIGFGAAMVAAACIAQAAQAATITYSGAATDIFYNGGSSAFAWQQFDPTAGFLNSVNYSVSGAFTFTLSQTSLSAIQPTYSISKGITLNGAGLSPRNASHGDFDAVINLGRPAGDVLTPGEVESQTVVVDFLRVPDLGLSSFIGAGTINAVLGISEDSDLCYSDALAGGAYHVDCSQTGNLKVSVIYDYTPGHATFAQAAPAQDTPARDTSVPEPVSVLVLGFGLAVTAVCAARKKTKALVPRP